MVGENRVLYRWGNDQDATHKSRIVTGEYSGRQLPANLVRKCRKTFRLAPAIAHAARWRDHRQCPDDRDEFQSHSQGDEPHVGDKTTFIFGKSPTLADFGFYGQLQSLATDPTPWAVMRQEGPANLPYLQLLDDASGIEPAEMGMPLVSAGTIDLLRTAADIYLPYLRANERAVTAGDQSFSFKVEGTRLRAGAVQVPREMLSRGAREVYLARTLGPLSGRGRPRQRRAPVLDLSGKEKRRHDRPLLLAHAERMQGNHPTSRVGSPYRLIPLNIGRGDQFKPEFAKISPNRRMPAIVDFDPADHASAISIFESGGILMYLAEKHNRFLPTSARDRCDALQWLMWQMGGLGPMCGQAHHFRQYVGTPVPYAAEQYQRGEPPVRKTGTNVWRTANSSPARIRSPTWPAGLGSSRTKGRARIWTISRT